MFEGYFYDPFEFDDLVREFFYFVGSKLKNLNVHEFLKVIRQGFNIVILNV